MNFLVVGATLRCLVQYAVWQAGWSPQKGDMRLEDQETKLEWNSYAEFGLSH